MGSLAGILAQGYNLECPSLCQPGPIGCRHPHYLCAGALWFLRPVIVTLVPTVGFSRACEAPVSVPHGTWVRRM